MALYAYDENRSPIFASDAEERRHYRCCGCNGTVRLRKGPARVPHFYHLALTPSCRLYGKSQDHLFAQLAIQKSLPAGESVLEQPFPDILRVGDLVWEPHKIVFEIQCSKIGPIEAKQRVNDYLKAGYQVVWILDDRIFNRNVASSAEQWMRKMPCYFATLRGQAWPFFYDQFEIFVQKRRVKKGQPLNIHIEQPHQLPDIAWDKHAIPKQVLQKVATHGLFFQGDLLHKALLSHAIPMLAASMQNLRALERLYGGDSIQKKFIHKLFMRGVLEPLGGLMYFLQKTNERWN